MKQERYTGCMLGLGVGDALGAPLEFMSASQILIKHGMVREMIGGGWLNVRPGETTDDTAMALALADSIVSKGGFDREDAAARYIDWLRTGPKDAGNTIRASLSRIAEGIPIDEASALAHSEIGGKSAGNGTAMRCAPLALAFADRDEELIIHSRAEAAITHHDPVAGGGSAALNIMISTALGPGKDKSSVIPRAREVLSASGESSTVPDPGSKDAGELRPTGYVIDSLECAIWAFLKGKGFEDCLVHAVNLGGDTDTIGAICGALSGAWYGASRIPARWLSALDRREDLENAGKALLQLSAPCS
ncbi:MAG: ADP-ribosylglycohydrolase family protein [Planctomycetota bacterium]|jgi:ADP-ribosyl-[dinitrogen reductase] hydrolase